MESNGVLFNMDHVLMVSLLNNADYQYLSLEQGEVLACSWDEELPEEAEIHYQGARYLPPIYMHDNVKCGVYHYDGKVYINCINDSLYCFYKVPEGRVAK